MDANTKKSPLIAPDEMARQAEFTDRVRAENERAFAENGTRKKCCIKTYGCQQNEADSERLAGMATAMGYEMTADETMADLILVNTCAVREHAELKALSITGQFKHLKEKNKSLIIGVCGCMVSQEHRKDDIKYKYPYVDLVFGTSMLHRFPEILSNKLMGGKRAFYLDDSPGVIAEGMPVRRESAYKAWVSIMYGCNNFCTYCIVPYVRGRERSRAKEDILAEVKNLVADGYKEITLLGQNVNSYGKDLYGGEYGFAELLSDIDRQEGDYLVRFMTSHPKDASDRLIDVMANGRHIAPHFHLPLQSGSDRILSRMNRHYTRDAYLDFVRRLREKIPHIALSTDIIVGFPGEDEEDFSDTLDMLSRVEFDMIYSFIFSKRKGTPAAEYEDQVPEHEKSARFARLLSHQNIISQKKNDAYLHAEVQVLCEGKSKSDERFYTGRTPENKIVHFAATDADIGTFVPVKITSAQTFMLFGEKI